MKRSNFTIQKMDCPSEEQMIRMKLEAYPQIKFLDFDILNRKLQVYHLGGIEDIQTSIASVKLGDTLQGTEEAEPPVIEDQSKQKKILWWVLGINFGFFVIEMTTGWISSSMGLIADSLDMLADSIVYALSLFAVGGAISRKKKVAKFSGYFQMTLASLGFMEILRRFFSESETPMFNG